MPQVAREPDAVNFDAYELRLSTREFLKHGLRIKLPPQAFQVLQMLVERAGPARSAARNSTGHYGLQTHSLTLTRVSTARSRRSAMHSTIPQRLHGTSRLSRGSDTALLGK